MSIYNRKKLFIIIELKMNQTSLVKFALALNIINSRSKNMTHSKFKKLSVLTQELLFKIVLIIYEQFEYIATL